MTRQINCPNDLNMTKGQEVALQHIADQLAAPRDQQAAGHDVVITVTVEATTYGNVWVKVEQDIPSLGAGNALRVLTACDSWFISVGPRGGMNARLFPNYAKGLKKVGRINISK